jgi:hypothetical protein
VILMPNAVDDTLGNRLTCCADSRSIALLMKVDIAMPGSDRTESPRRSAARQRTAAPTMVTAAIIIVTMPQITSFGNRDHPAVREDERRDDQPDTDQKIDPDTLFP